MSLKRSIIMAFVLLVMSSLVGTAFAAEIEVQGEGSAFITEDVAQVQLKAQREALKNAVKVALDRVLGQNANKNPKVQQNFEHVMSQLGTYKIKQTDTARREEDNYIVNTLLIIDDMKFRKLLSDTGIALGTTTMRASAILTIMDEFFTTPSDLNNPLPLRDVTVYRYDRDTDYKEREALSKKGLDSKSVSARSQEAGSVSSSQQGSGSYSGKGDMRASSPDASLSASGAENAKYSQTGSLDTRYGNNSSLDASSLKKNALNYGRFVSAFDNEHEFFTNVKEYQPKNSIPSKENDTIAALGNAFREYDIRSLSNDLFRSKYFGNQVITIEKLENSQDLAKYVKFAKADAKADFFAIGTSVIVDRGKNQNTGRNVCDGMVVVKVYSTTDGETIASGALTESGSGNSPDQCRTNVANKIGLGLGSTIANQIQEYWKTRQMYGMEYVLLLIGDFPPMARIQFTNVLKQVQGVQNVKLRTAETGKNEFVLNYSGSGQLGDEIFMKLAESPLSTRFANYEADIEGNQIKLHPPALAPSEQPAHKKGKK
jgi:hypothetical protein